MQPTRPIILVVEDEPPTYELLRQVLEPAGYAVEIATDGDTAQEELLDGGIDLVLLDLMLPGMDGLELCRWVRAHEGEVYLPIIMLTASTAAAQRHAGFAAGADDYMVKPFDAEELRDRVHVWVRTRQRLQLAHEQQLRAQELARARERLAPDTAVQDTPRARSLAASLKEAVEHHEGWVHHLVAEAAQRPGFLDAMLIPYARAQGWDETDLAAALGCPRATLPLLLLRARPLPRTWEADVAAIAEACGADPAALAAVLRAAEAWEAEAQR